MPLKDRKTTGGGNCVFNTFILDFFVKEVLDSYNFDEPTHSNFFTMVADKLGVSKAGLKPTLIDLNNSKAGRTTLETKLNQALREFTFSLIKHHPDYKQFYEEQIKFYFETAFNDFKYRYQQAEKKKTDIFLLTEHKYVEDYFYYHRKLSIADFETWWDQHGFILFKKEMEAKRKINKQNIQKADGSWVNLEQNKHEIKQQFKDALIELKNQYQGDDIFTERDHKNVLQYFENNLDKESQALYQQWYNDGGYHSFLTKLTTNGVWVGHLELEVLARFFNLSIHIIDTNNVVIKKINDSLSSTERKLIFRFKDNHYSAVVEKSTTPISFGLSVDNNAQPAASPTFSFGTPTSNSPSDSLSRSSSYDFTDPFSSPSSSPALSFGRQISLTPSSFEDDDLLFSGNSPILRSIPVFTGGSPTFVDPNPPLDWQPTSDKGEITHELNGDAIPEAVSINLARMVTQLKKIESPLTHTNDHLIALLESAILIIEATKTISANFTEAVALIGEYISQATSETHLLEKAVQLLEQDYFTRVETQHGKRILKLMTSITTLTQDSDQLTKLREIADTYQDYVNHGIPLKTHVNLIRLFLARQHKKEGFRNQTKPAPEGSLARVIHEKQDNWQEIFNTLEEQKIQNLAISKNIVLGRFPQTYARYLDPIDKLQATSTQFILDAIPDLLAIQQDDFVKYDDLARYLPSRETPESEFSELTDAELDDINQYAMFVEAIAFYELFDVNGDLRTEIYNILNLEDSLSKHILIYGKEFVYNGLIKSYFCNISPQIWNQIADGIRTKLVEEATPEIIGSAENKIIVINNRLERIIKKEHELTYENNPLLTLVQTYFNDSLKQGRYKQSVEKFIKQKSQYIFESVLACLKTRDVADEITDLNLINSLAFFHGTAFRLSDVEITDTALSKFKQGIMQDILMWMRDPEITDKRYIDLIELNHFAVKVLKGEFSKQAFYANEAVKSLLQDINNRKYDIALRELRHACRFHQTATNETTPEMSALVFLKKVAKKKRNAAHPTVTLTHRLNTLKEAIVNPESQPDYINPVKQFKEQGETDKLGNDLARDLLFNNTSFKDFISQKDATLDLKSLSSNQIEPLLAEFFNLTYFDNQNMTAASRSAKIFATHYSQFFGLGLHAGKMGNAINSEKIINVTMDQGELYLEVTEHSLRVGSGNEDRAELFYQIPGSVILRYHMSENGRKLDSIVPTNHIIRKFYTIPNFCTKADYPYKNYPQKKGHFKKYIVPAIQNEHQLCLLQLKAVSPNSIYKIAAEAILKELTLYTTKLASAESALPAGKVLEVFNLSGPQQQLISINLLTLLRLNFANPKNPKLVHDLQRELTQASDTISESLKTKINSFLALNRYQPQSEVPPKRAEDTQKRPPEKRSEDAKLSFLERELLLAKTAYLNKTDFTPNEIDREITKRYTRTEIQTKFNTLAKKYENDFVMLELVNHLKSYHQFQGQFDHFKYCARYRDDDYKKLNAQDLSDQAKAKIKTIIKQANQAAWLNHPEALINYQKSTTAAARGTHMRPYAADVVWIEAAKKVRAITHDVVKDVKLLQDAVKEAFQHHLPQAKKVLTDLERVRVYKALFKGLKNSADPFQHQMVVFALLSSSKKSTLQTAILQALGFDSLKVARQALRKQLSNVCRQPKDMDRLEDFAAKIARYAEAPFEHTTNTIQSNVNNLLVDLSLLKLGETITPENKLLDPLILENVDGAISRYRYHINNDPAVWSAIGFGHSKTGQNRALTYHKLFRKLNPQDSFPIQILLFALFSSPNGATLQKTVYKRLGFDSLAEIKKALNASLKQHLGNVNLDRVNQFILQVAQFADSGKEADDVTITQLLNDLATLKPTAKLATVSAISDLNFSDRVAHIEDDDKTAKLKLLVQQLSILLSEQSFIHPEYEKVLTKKIQEICMLRVIAITNTDKTYCQAGETTGVTEKIPLIEYTVVEEKLNNLYRDLNQDPLETLKRLKSDNNKESKHYTLSTQGIIKLAKHGNIKSVQEEAIALNISRILGFTTTKSTAVTYEGVKTSDGTTTIVCEPGLLIPFDNIQLLTNLTHGDKRKPFSLKSEYYTDNATLKPVGEGLMAVSDTLVTDFGMQLAYYYLCGDPDVFGRDNQNKALTASIDADGMVTAFFKNFYNFDTTINLRGKFALNSNLTLEPVGITKHSRHDKGRNKTLVEDTDFNSKFGGLIHMVRHKDTIIELLNKTINDHAIKIKQLNQKQQCGIALTQQEEINLKNTQELYLHALKMKHVISKRLNHALDQLPHFNNKTITLHELSGYTPIYIRQSLILEKIVNAPVLFTSKGRPYKHPYTKKHHNLVKNIYPSGDSNLIIEFQTSIDPAYLKALARRGVTLARESNTTYKISEEDLLRLKENILFPEQHEFYYREISLNAADQSLSPAAYLDPQEIRLISRGYNTSERNQILEMAHTYHLNATREYNALMAGSNKTLALQALQNGLAASNKLIERLPKRSVGLAKHIHKKIMFDIQNKLLNIFFHAFESSSYQRLVSDSLTLEKQKAEIIRLYENAYNAAVKLDRANEFTSFILSISCKQEALLQAQREGIPIPREYKDLYIDTIRMYLDKCHHIAETAQDHASGVRASIDFYNETLKCEEVLIKDKPLATEPLMREEENSSLELPPDDSPIIRVIFVYLGTAQHQDVVDNQMTEFYDQIVTGTHTQAGRKVIVYKHLINGPGALPGTENVKQKGKHIYDHTQNSHPLQRPTKNTNKMNNANPMLGTYDVAVAVDDKIPGKLNVIKTEKDAGFVSTAIPGQLMGVGYKEAHDETLKVIEALAETYPGSVIETKLTGFSRGGMHTISVGNAITRSYPSNLAEKERINSEKNVVIVDALPIDPVPGSTRRNRISHTIIGKNVRSVKVIYHLGDKRFLFKPQDFQHLYAADWNATDLEAVILEGTHTSPLKVRIDTDDPTQAYAGGVSDAGVLLHHHMNHWAHVQGIPLKNSMLPYVVKAAKTATNPGHKYIMPGKELDNASILNGYTNMLLNKPWYDQYTYVRQNIFGYLYEREILKNKRDYLLHGNDYFYDKTHMKVFQEQFPCMFDYFFQASSVGHIEMDNGVPTMVKTLPYHVIEELKTKVVSPLTLTTLLKSLRGIVDFKKLNNDKVKSIAQFIELLKRPHAEINIGPPTGIPVSTQIYEQKELMHLWRQANWLCHPVQAKIDNSITKASAKDLLDTIHKILTAGHSDEQKIRRIHHAFYKAWQLFHKDNALFGLKLASITRHNALIYADTRLYVLENLCQKDLEKLSSAEKEIPLANLKSAIAEIKKQRNNRLTTDTKINNIDIIIDNLKSRVLAHPNNEANKAIKSYLDTFKNFVPPNTNLVSHYILPALNKYLEPMNPSRLFQLAQNSDQQKLAKKVRQIAKTLRANIEAAKGDIKQIRDYIWEASYENTKANAEANLTQDTSGKTANRSERDEFIRCIEGILRTLPPLPDMKGPKITAEIKLDHTSPTITPVNVQHSGP